jgi:hypothetical protein
VSAGLTVDRAARERAGSSWQVVLPPASVAITGLVVSMLFACAVLLATTQLGSGDYGQWLMSARPYAGLDMPAYRADAAVPPLVPLLLGTVLRLVGDPVVALHVVAVAILVALVAGVYLAGRSLFDAFAGLLAAVAATLVSDLFLQLFTFGGLLQAASIALLWLSIAVLWRARRTPQHASRWLVLGAVCIGLGGLTHTGSASITIPTGVAVAVLVVAGLPGGWPGRLKRLIPLAVILVAVAGYWLVALLPGAADLARNPASLDYRGPGRLLDGLIAAWPNVAVIGLGTGATIVGAGVELARRRIGPWLAILAWLGVTLGVLGAAIMSGASTDYPRFVTPIMAPLVVAAAGGVAVLLRAAGSAVASGTRTGSPRGWAVLAAGMLLAAAIPSAVGGFGREAHGYEVADAPGLSDASAWIRANLPADAVVRAGAREGKWIEGLSGRGALFSNAVRYSFRAEEWQRSLAADTLLRSTGGALANEFFFARLTDAGAFDASPRSVAIAANHGGEFVDLLSTVSAGTSVLAPDGSVLATLANLDLSSASLGLQGDDAVSQTVWTGARAGGSVELHRTVSLHRSGSTLELELAVPDSLASGSLELTLSPAGATALERTELRGTEANLWYRPLGSQPPHLRIVVAGTNATLRSQPNGRLLAHADGRLLRVLVTDLTAADFPGIGLQALDPAQLVDHYGVRAALLQRDPSLAARERRLESLGFHVATRTGAYELLLRDTALEAGP